MKMLRSVLFLLVVIPVIVLSGWVLNNTYLYSIVPGLTPMNPLSAVCFLLVAVALALAAVNAVRATVYLRWIGAFVALVGAIMLLKYFFQIDLQIDRILFSDRLLTNRLAPNTAFNFLMTGLALLLFTQQNSKRWIVLVLVGITAYVSLLSMLGYLYGLRLLFGIPGFTPMALHTAFCFLLVSFVFVRLLLFREETFVGRKIWVNLVLALVVVLGLGAISGSIVKNAQGQEDRTARAYQTIQALNDVGAALVDAETGQRGYLLTGKDSYLEPYNQAKNIVRERIQSLQLLFDADGKNGAALTERISNQSQLKLAELDQTIRLKRAGKTQEALAIVNSDKGKQYLDSVRAELATQEASQRQELGQLVTAADQSRRNALWLLATGAALDTLLVLVAFFFIQQALRQRQEAQDRMAETAGRLRVEKNKDEALLRSIGDAVFAIDNDGRITLFNPAAEQISGYSAKEALGRPYAEVLQFVFERPGVGNAELLINDEFIRRALGGKLASMRNHTALVRRDGVRLPVADSAAPIFDSQDRQSGAIVVFRDVSRERELEQAKTEFVSVASHQLRTPLSAINWYAEMLLNGDAGQVTPEQHDYLQEIYDGNQRMIELVGSLLNVSRLDVGKLRNEPAETDMGELADSLQQELSTMITTKHIKFRRETTAKLLPVFADPKLLRMVLQNLLSNAVKYTPEKGSVKLVMRPAGPADLTKAKLRRQQPYLYMSVADTGYGIPVSQQSMIFGKLFRADNVRKLEVEGTGLGLYIVKEVVENLGGRVWFESVEGQGTTFYVVMPFTTKASDKKA